MNNTKLFSAVTTVIGVLLIILGIIILNTPYIFADVFGVQSSIAGAGLLILVLLILFVAYITVHNRSSRAQKGIESCKENG